MKRLIIPIFFILFLIYPFAFSINNGFYFICAILLLLAIVKIKNIMSKKYKIQISEKLVKFYPLIIILQAVITRIGSAMFLNDNLVQVSDFNSALNVANTMQFQEPYHRIFIHWILLPYITHFLFNIFGSSQLVALIFNGIICVLSTIMIYFVTCKLVKNKNISFLASMLYILWPANILYVGIYTTEHITQLLLLIGVFLILKGNEERKSVKKYILFFISGIMLGLTTFFKNFGLVFIIALVIYFVLKCIFSAKEDLKKKVITSLISFVILVIGNFLIVQITYVALDNIIGAKVSRDNTTYFLTVGLISNNNGTYNATIGENYKRKIVENNYNYDAVNKEMCDILIKDIISNKNLGKKLENKAKVIVGGDKGRVGFVIRSAKENGSIKLKEFIEKYILDLNDFYYMVLFILIGVGILKFRKDTNLEVLFIYISIYGTYLLLVLIEAQNRYTYGINSFICILAAIGFGYLFNYKKEEAKPIF